MPPVVVIDDADVLEKARSLRPRFTELRFCFETGRYTDLIERLLGFVAA